MEESPLIQIPEYHTSLIGRSADVAALTAHLHDPATRLLTIVGPSGSGKTRLALEVVTSVAAGFADGVVFVALAPVQEPRFVISTIAQTLGIREEGETPLLTILGQALVPRHMLLLLTILNRCLPARPTWRRCLLPPPA